MEFVSTPRWKYSLMHAPVFVQEASDEEICFFNEMFPKLAQKCFRILEQNPHISPHTVIGEKFGGITIGECCLIWIKITSFHDRITWFKKQLIKTSKDANKLTKQIARCDFYLETPHRKLIHSFKWKEITQAIHSIE